MNPQNSQLIIKDWPKGVADSPHLGLAMLKNLEIDTYPGAVRVGKKPITAFHTALSQTFTADSSTDIMTISGGTMPITGTAVTVSNSGGALPTGLSAATNYFIIKLSSTTFKLATTRANANASTAIDITSNGSGTNTVATVDPGTINHFANDPRTNTRFAIDSNGRVWYKSSSIYLLLDGNTLTNAAGQGLAIFRTSDGNATYLFVYRNAVIDVINVFGTSNLETPVWSTAWKSMNSGAGSGNSHHSIVGQDNIIYFTDDRYIGSIQEKPGSVFDPATAGTYTYNNQALSLPLGALTYWLEQLGINLLVSVSNDSYVYPWDRSSISYGLPLPVAEFGINKMKNIGNIVYILAGTHGNIYWTQGTYVKVFKTIPVYLTYNTTTPASNPLSWGGIAAVLGKLIVGVGATSGESGVYMVDSNGVLTIDNYPSTGQAKVTALYALNEFYDMGYAGGADTMDTSRYSNYEAVLQSALYRVGTKTLKTKYSQCEIQIASPVSGTVKVSWRRNETGSWTAINNESGTATTFTTDTNNTSYQVDCGLIDIENIQIKVELAGNLDLMEVRINP
jgi:hypothetical protein